jgi:hypothetical protein
MSTTPTTALRRLSGHAARAYRMGAVIGLLALTGCASMSEQECVVVNWQEKGMQDAYSGYTRARIESHREACTKAGVLPDVARYNNGWEEGIQGFCVPSNGLRWGREGRNYNQSCPPQLEADFLDEYWVGKRVYDAERNLRQLTSERKSKQNQLDRAKEMKDRRRLLQDLELLSSRIRSAQDELFHAERRMRRRQ